VAQAKLDSFVSTFGKAFWPSYSQPPCLEVLLCSLAFLSLLPALLCHCHLHLLLSCHRAIAASTPFPQLSCHRAAITLVALSSFIIAACAAIIVDATAIVASASSVAIALPLLPPIW
jgi:hypothetical protein